MRNLFSFLIIALLAPSAWALALDKQLADPAQEQQAQMLFHELRCIVCEGQSLADSDAQFAQQMRAEVRRRLDAGDDADAVKDYFVQQYGAQILQRPPLIGAGAPLWLVPLLLLAVAGWMLRPRRRKETP